MKFTVQFVLLMTAAAPAWGAALPPAFTAECTAGEVYAYRNTVKSDGTVLDGQKWSTGEKFFSTWRFKWVPPNKISIDGEGAVFLGATANSVSFLVYGNNYKATSATLYNLNLRGCPR